MRKDFDLMVKRGGVLDLASLYDVCEWFIKKYPDDIFVSKAHPVHKIRDLCKIVLNLKEGGKR